MKHKVQVVAQKKISNGKTSICFRCCDNETTDSWHTMANSVVSSPKKRIASIKSATMRVAKEHDDALKAEKVAPKLAGQTEEITIK